MPESMEIRFTLNGAEVRVETDPKRSALRVLRDDLGHTTLKPGCDPQGICGSCCALVDGKPRLTCTLPVKSVGGKSVTTQDGLTPLQAEAFSEAFASAGGTQCAYCIPGIVMQVKALLDKTPEPTDDDIAKALQMHVCRCTGWKKIHDSVHLAARWLREGGVPRGGGRGEGLGSGWQTDEARLAVLGQRPYIDDMTRPGLLHGALRWTPSARCRVLKVDPAPALAMPGVHAVVTGADLARREPGAWPLLVAVGEETRCTGDLLAAVAADTPEIARAAADAVLVEVEDLPPLTDVEAAAQDASRVTVVRRFERGEVRSALAGAARVVEESFTTQVVEPSFLEPEGALAVPLEGGWLLYSAGQRIFEEQAELSRLFGLDGLVVESVPSGGAFGARGDLHVSAHALALGLRTGRPVKLSLSMEESTRYHAKRPAYRMRYRVGCDADGLIVGVEADILADVGGYAGAGVPDVAEAAAHATGPYRVPNARVEARAVTTNNPVAGGFRGLGVPPVCFALEGCLDRLADALGLDPLELRARNLLQPGALSTLDALRPAYEAAKAAGRHAGVAVAMKGLGLAGQRELGRVVLQVVSPREIHLYTGFAESGQGHEAVISLLASEATGLPAAIFSVRSSTAEAVGSGGTCASRATYLAGNALFAAADQLKAALREAGGDLGALAGRRFTGTWESSAADGGHAAYSFAAQLAVVGADGKLEEIVAAHDVGRVLQRVACEGQVEGGVHMGVGYALSEELVIDDKGVPDTRFRNFGIVKDRHMPKLTTLLLEQPDPNGPWGARGVSELGLIPTAPAIAAAIRRFDGVWRHALPMRDTEAARAMGVKPAKR